MSPTRVDSAYEPNALPNVPKDVFGCTLKFLIKKKKKHPEIAHGAEILMVSLASMT